MIGSDGLLEPQAVKHHASRPTVMLRKTRDDENTLRCKTGRLRSDQATFELLQVRYNSGYNALGAESVGVPGILIRGTSELAPRSSPDLYNMIEIVNRPEY